MTDLTILLQVNWGNVVTTGIRWFGMRYIKMSHWVAVYPVTQTMLAWTVSYWLTHGYPESRPPTSTSRCIPAGTAAWKTNKVILTKTVSILWLVVMFKCVEHYACHILYTRISYLAPTHLLNGAVSTEALPLQTRIADSFPYHSMSPFFHPLKVVDLIGVEQNPELEAKTDFIYCCCSKLVCTCHKRHFWQLHLHKYGASCGLMTADLTLFSSGICLRQVTSSNGISDALVRIQHLCRPGLSELNTWLWPPMLFIVGQPRLNHLVFFQNKAGACC